LGTQKGYDLLSELGIPVQETDGIGDTRLGPQGRVPLGAEIQVNCCTSQVESHSSSLPRTVSCPFKV
jgi:hypothetical protein